MKKRWVAIGVVGAGLLLGPVVVPIFFPWSGINCRYQEINIKTGQARYSRTLWFLTMSERIEDTPLSLALQGESLDVAAIGAWQPVNTLSLWIHHSPHYAFHSALGQARSVGAWFKAVGASDDSRKETAKAILRIWQTTKMDFEADEYIEELWREQYEEQRGER